MLDAVTDFILPRLEVLQLVLDVVKVVILFNELLEVES
jgi:hypothetical protein